MTSIQFRFNAIGVLGRSFAVLAIAAVLTRPADAILLTTSAGISASAPTIGFSQFFAAGRIVFQTGDPPIEIGDLDSETVVLRPVSGTSTVAVIAGQHTPPVHPDNSYYLGLNGGWGPGRDGFLGIGGGNGSMVTARIEFASGPVSVVGGTFNYSPAWPPIIMSALDSSLSVLEQYTVNELAPISTPSQVDVGEFRGIKRNQNDIFALQFSAPFAVIDDIRFSRVPEPSTFILAAITIASAALISRANQLRG